MLNRDINSRFEDWLLSPTESLDFEVKKWLDMDDVEAQGLVAKALIALENHGGGFLLFGYAEDREKKLVPDPNRPASLQPYLTDAINAIIKKRAEPAFHVEVTLQRHPQTGDEYPLVRVDGRSKVPVRSDSATSGGALKQYVYYIRASGPESRGPLAAAEWDALISRVILNQRDEIVSVLRSFLSVSPIVAEEAVALDTVQLKHAIDDSMERWRSLNESLAPEHPARIVHGFYRFAARIEGKSKNTPLKVILGSIESAHRYTGWPMFVALHQEDTRPKLVDGSLQAWLARVPSPDVGHADFWRIDPAGNYFSLRGYQEDEPGSNQKPGTAFEVTLPIWRLGEFLLRVVELGGVMFDSGFQVLVDCEWNGLKGRKLYHHNDRWFTPGYRSEQESTNTTGRYSQEVIHDLLPDVVKELTKALYEHFDLYQPSDAMYVEELSRLTGRSFR